VAVVLLAAPALRRLSADALETERFTLGFTLGACRRRLRATLLLARLRLTTKLRRHLLGRELVVPARCAVFVVATEEEGHLDPALLVDRVATVIVVREFEALILEHRELRGHVRPGQDLEHPALGFARLGDLLDLHLVRVDDHTFAAVTGRATLDRHEECRPELADDLVLRRDGVHHPGVDVFGSHAGLVALVGQEAHRFGVRVLLAHALGPGRIGRDDDTLLEGGLRSHNDHRNGRRLHGRAGGSLLAHLLHAPLGERNEELADARRLEVVGNLLVSPRFDAEHGLRHGRVRGLSSHHESLLGVSRLNAPCAGGGMILATTSTENLLTSTGGGQENSMNTSTILA